MSPGREPVCATCQQPIREGEPKVLDYGDSGPCHKHWLAPDCVAAAVRRCAGIAEEEENATDSPHEVGWTEASERIKDRIRAEFKPPQEPKV